MGQLKIEHKIGAASVVVAALGVALSFWQGLWGSGEAGDVNTVGNVTGGGNVTIIQSYAEARAELDASPNDERAFIGALDGHYEYRRDALLEVRAEADFAAEKITFVRGNCAFTGPFLQKGQSWLVYKETTDGVCAFLDEIETGHPVARIIPLPRSRSNNGRVNEFFVESAQFAIDEISGTYKWISWGR